ncbi:hypothetical protein AKJ51_00125 [candidate division MSBL1 archaeon SCGC-AAA382A20]|uniref:Uncharacterized protein n=1 Tax=candidate division MSBL1 archaeon SCGC-AAA382A20 TaxID=1698280 RepID=A0A133VMS2_9EURY|nr:hypothetical protein AKJ51_00125 [candidate division MSBL1 archaeon SCGC-AAA382A20]
MSEKRIISDAEIEELLEEFNPSELDSAMSRMCPFYKNGDTELTSVYGSIHRFVQSRLLAKLQLKLDDLSIAGELRGDDGERIDGIVTKYRVALNGKKVEILTENGEETHEVAVLEVKTGSFGPLQPAAYAHQWGLPVIVIEIKTEDVHLVDQQTASKFLSEAASHMENMENLKDEGQKIPDYYQCKDCRNTNCEYSRDDENNTGNDAIKKKSEILENLDNATEKTVSTIREILEESDYTSTIQSSESQEVLEK